jgi:restriction system protein
MPIPDYQQIMLPLLICIKDGQVHDMREAVEQTAVHFGLNEVERTHRLPSGKQFTFDNRVGWARTYLKKAGLVQSPGRGMVQITSRGKEILAANPEKIDASFLEQFPEYLEFKYNQKVKPSEPTTQLSPEESLEVSYQDLRTQLAQDILERVKLCSPDFFERLVVDLLVAMGYGGSRRDAGQRVGKTGDGGIDGIIKEDKLGLGIVNIQAKRWQNTVGRPDIQGFVGSLAGTRAKKGVFITTSKFSNDALDYVTRIEHKVVLIDGETLAQFMIDHNVGVSEESHYIVKKVDLDYFEEN